MGGHLPVMPVLAEQAIEGASAVEHGQVLVATARVALADPVGNAVARQRIKVPVQQPLRWRARKVSQRITLIAAQTAIACLSLGHAALVDA